MFGDEKYAVDSSMNPHSKIRKRYIALSFNRIRETIVAGIISYCFVQGSLKPAGMFSKCWSRHKVKFMLKRLIFGKETLRSYLSRNKLSGSIGIHMFILIAYFIFHIFSHMFYCYCEKV